VPVWLYRARLGFVFGSRLLMLEHAGRKTSARRYVVLEAIDQPSPRTYVVVSGFGDRAARTAIRTWPGPGRGSGRSTISRTSGPRTG